MHSNDPLYFAVSYDSDFQILDPPKSRDLSPLFVCGPPPERPPVPTLGLGIESRLARVRDDPDLDNPGFYSETYTRLSPTTLRSASFNQEKAQDMPTRKRRVSVQSILLPSFLQGSSSTPTSPDGQTPSFNAQNIKRPSRIRAHSSATVSGTWSILRQDDLALSPLAPASPSSILTSPRDSPPPDFLLDDDPFANLTTGPTISRQPVQTPTSPPPPPPEEVKLPPTPRSPLMPTVAEVPPKSLTRANSGGPEDKKLPVPPRVFTTRSPVAAHQRPAFSARPSLPSLSTLAQMNVVLTKKVRKGRVGAGLPFEPWDNPNGEVSPRVLQDVHGASTESLPTGTQPLLPSQIVGIATNASTGAPVRNEVELPSHTYTAPPSPSVIPREPSSTSVPFPSVDEEHPQWSHTEEAHESQSSHRGFPSTSSSDESGHGDPYENYYSEDEDDAAPALSLDDEALAMYQRYQQYAESDIETDTTTMSNSCDELSPPPSSRVSSFDLEHPHSLSRSLSSSSSRVSESSSSRSSVGHEGEDGRLQADFEPASRMSAVIALETQLRISLDSCSIGTSTRSSMEDSDSLHSPTNPGFDVLPQIVTSPDSYHILSLPKRPPTPGLTSSSFHSQSAGTHYPASHSTTSSSLWAPASPDASSYFPTLPASGSEQQHETGPAAEPSAKDMVARWRDRYSRMGSFGSGSGSFLSDLELADPLVALSSGSSSKQPSRGPSMDETELAPVVESATEVPETRVSTPSARSSDEWFQPSYPKLKATARLAAPEGSWPSSADTVRPFSRYAPKIPFEFPSTHDGELGREDDGEDKALGVDEDGNPINSNDLDEFDGVAIESRGGGGAVMISVPYEERPRHSSALDSAEDPFELERRQALGKSVASHSSFTSATTDESSSASASASLSASTSTSHSAHSTTSSVVSTASSSSSDSSDSSSVYKDHQHDEECFDMLRYQAQAQWDGYGYGGSGGVVDASGQDGGYRGRSASHSAHYQQDVGGSGGGLGSGQGARYNAPSAWGQSGGGRGDDGDDEDDRRRRQLHRGPESLAFSSSSGRDSEDDNPLSRSLTLNSSSTRQRPSHSQLSSPSQQPALRSFPAFSAATSSDDDDVPLAQRIPTALTAQKSIRRQVREERHQKKLERAATMASKSSTREHSDRDRRLGESTAGFSRERHETLRPAGAGGPIIPPPLPLSSSQEAAMAAVGGVPSSSSGASTSQQRQPSQGVSVERRTTRARANTLHSKPAQEPFSAEDLATRLQSVQVGAEQQQQQHQGWASAGGAAPSSFGMRSAGPATGARTSFDNTEQRSTLARGRTLKEQPSAPFPGASPTSSAQAVRHMRSFQRDVKGGAPDDWTTRPLESEQRLAIQRQLSRSHSRAAKQEEPSTRKRSASVSRAVSASHSYGVDDALAPPMPPLPSKPVLDEHVPRKMWKASVSGRTSMEGDRAGALGRSPTAPAVPVPTGPVVQQRFFVGDMQRFNMVEIHSGTTAGEVVEMIDAQGGLKGISGAGGWMVFEVAQDFGMERPIRSFELLSDVQASWNKDKMVNLFVLKLTPLALPLSRNAIPSSSPIHSGYVEWEQKRGKWSKRFMQLREHSLWLSKREGKEQVLLCSLSNFDAYMMSRNHRTPKPFAFSVKSTDSFNFFENASDYVHNFSCNENEGKRWLEKILVARSYVLHQERQVLFNPKAAGGNAAGAALSRAGTLARKPTTRRPC